MDYTKNVLEGLALDSCVPPGDISEKWTKHKFNMKLVNPANKRKYTILVIGTGLGGGAAACLLYTSDAADE